MIKKICAVCGQLKTGKDFYLRGGKERKKAYLRSVCIKCYWKSRASAHKKWAHTTHGRFLMARKIAKMHKHIWALSEEDYTVLLKLPCYYCRRIHFETGIGLDRIDNSLGYEKTNVLPCCGTCNRIRCHLLTVEEMKAVMEMLIKFRAEKKIKESLAVGGLRGAT